MQNNLILRGSTKLKEPLTSKQKTHLLIYLLFIGITERYLLILNLMGPSPYIIGRRNPTAGSQCLPRSGSEWG